MHSTAEGSTSRAYGCGAHTNSADIDSTGRVFHCASACAYEVRLASRARQCGYLPMRSEVSSQSDTWTLKVKKYMAFDLTNPLHGMMELKELQPKTAADEDRLR